MFRNCFWAASPLPFFLALSQMTVSPTTVERMGGTRTLANVRVAQEQSTL